MINKFGSFSQQTSINMKMRKIISNLLCIKSKFLFLLVVCEQYVIIICGYQNFEFKTTADLMEMQISLWFTEED